MTLRLNKLVLVLTSLLALAAFFGAGGAVGYLYGRDESRPTAQTQAGIEMDSAKPKPAPSEEEIWKPFWQTYELINSEYYGRPVDKQKLVNAAAQGMVSSLGDPYTSYLPPAQRQMAEDDLRGRFEGIGVYVEVKNKQFTVVSPIENSPAEKAGMKRGDVITAVNGQSIAGMDQTVVIRKIRGPKGTSVRLTIKRGNQKPFDIKVVRDEIQVQQVTFKMVEGDIAYVNANIFGDKTTAELDAALRQAKEAGAKGIILDLRDNGGGWVTAAREMVGRFVPEGVAMYEDRTQGPGGEEPLDLITGDVSVYDLPMVVLVNKGSASASEIVAGALQAQDRAKLVGDRTFGKGSEQSVRGLEGGSSAHITIAHWLTPDKVDIHGKGLKPDVLVKSGDKDQEDAGPQFEKAVDTLREMMR